MKPFRWNIKKREQLGRLVSGAPPETYTEFPSQLRECSARVVAVAGDSNLVFVGRSPESLFDYLSGVFLGSNWSNRLSLVNLSLRGQEIGAGAHEQEVALQGFRQHLSDLELSPSDIASSNRLVTLVDLVASGQTFGKILGLLTQWASQEGVDVSAVRRRLRFVGVTWRSKPSPNTFRWHQHASWLETFPRIVAKNVSIPGVLWNYLGNNQSKVAVSHPPWRWADTDAAKPPRQESNIEALRLALELFELGSCVEERQLFASQLANQHAMRESWFRGLINELRGCSV